MWKQLVVLLALFSAGALASGKYKVSKERIEQIKREAKWVPYSLLAMMQVGFLTLENEAVPSS